MIKKAGVSLVLVLECAMMLIYFLRMSHDPHQIYWHQYGWTVFYNTSTLLPLCLLSLLFALSNKEERCVFDKYFLLIIGLFTFIINIAVVAQYYGLIAHTYGLQASALGIIVATALIVKTAYEHGYYE